MMKEKEFIHITDNATVSQIIGEVIVYLSKSNRTNELKSFVVLCNTIQCKSLDQIIQIAKQFVDIK